MRLPVLCLIWGREEHYSTWGQSRSASRSPKWRRTHAMAGHEIRGCRWLLPAVYLPPTS